MSLLVTGGLDELVLSGQKSLDAVLTNSKIFDCGSKKGFLGANIALASKDRVLKKYLMEIIK
tara:strand:- start:6180 stop:6365 length:186 start_codon:yes stop_codon:yes gene_type:complete